MTFSGKIAIVTGAGRGIGRAIAERFVESGAAVVIAEIDPATGARAAEALSVKGAARFVQTDVADESSVQQMIAETAAAFGRIDCLVNNAAIGLGSPPDRLALDDWNAVLGVNLTGPFLCTKHAAEHLARTHGSVVNIASTRAFMSERNTEAYSASKAGLVGLTHATAISLGPAVRVNCISPGWINSRDELKPLGEADHAQHPAGRVGLPADVAALVLFLCSDQAGFITGQNFVIDGGMTKKMIYT